MAANWQLLDMRSRIRLIDTQLVILLSRRCEIMREVRAWKESQGLPLVDIQREQDVLAHSVELGRSLGVPESIVRNLYEQLFAQVRGVMPETGLIDIKAEGAAGPEDGDQAPDNR